MYPTELAKNTTKSNSSALYLDLLLSIGRDSQLRTSLYDKHDDFNFHITNFPFLSNNLPSPPAYGVFISQRILYSRACSSYELFILRAVRLSNKLLGQVYGKRRRILTQSFDKSPYTNRKVKRAKSQHKTKPPKSSITQRLRTDLGRWIGVSTATQLVWFTGLRAQPSNSPQQPCDQDGTHLKNCK